MEKTKILNGNELEPLNEKAKKLADKIDTMWKPPHNSKQFKIEKKKLTIKLATYGAEKRKIVLKLESGKSKLHSNNYNLIAELLKEFFDTSN